MTGLDQLAKVLLITGLCFVVVALVLLTLGRIPFLGRLPGDIVYRRGNFTFYMPLATMLLLSLIFTLVLNLIFRR
ncbi:DUF2905 domain-containing protein [Thermorudis peleae]|jgi:hypothetical protein|uniref:DUF2905 domain-containing protein n=1 Tax=Thermorudis peleae TaxID=1382356 RepID=UPI00056FD5A4|nr:DUF2905 domain-containing protein [Thermorudis peleae]MBX6752940.1 DUF2905 domain-containing protein [Thermorudis peleae]